MRDYLYVGCTPAEEECAQVGRHDPDMMRHEAKAFILAIKRVLGEPPPDAVLAVKAESHDAGTYYEVICRYETDDKEQSDYADKADGEAPMTWAAAGMKAPYTYNPDGSYVTNGDPNNPETLIVGEVAKVDA